MNRQQIFFIYLFRESERSDFNWKKVQFSFCLGCTFGVHFSFCFISFFWTFLYDFWTFSNTYKAFTIKTYGGFIFVLGCFVSVPFFEPFSFCFVSFFVSFFVLFQLVFSMVFTRCKIPAISLMISLDAISKIIIFCFVSVGF